MRKGTFQLFVGILLLGQVFAAAETPRPKLQFINGSAQTANIFWLKSDTKRVPNGSVAPGESTIITTTLGHRFAVVGRSHAASEGTNTVRHFYGTLTRFLHGHLPAGAGPGKDAR